MKSLPALTTCQRFGLNRRTCRSGYMKEDLPLFDGVVTRVERGSLLVALDGGHTVRTTLCQTASKFDPVLEWAPIAGQD